MYKILVFVPELHSDSTSNDIFSFKQKTTACNLLAITTSSEKVMFILNEVMFGNGTLTPVIKMHSISSDTLLIFKFMWET